MPPVILLQGDHGSQAAARDRLPTARRRCRRTAARERFGAFGAYYLPGGGAEAFGDTVTVVNVLGNVLRHYFGAHLPRAGDEQYISPARFPLQFPQGGCALADRRRSRPGEGRRPDADSALDLQETSMSLDPRGPARRRMRPPRRPVAPRPRPPPAPSRSSRRDEVQGDRRRARGGFPGGAADRHARIRARVALPGGADAPLRARAGGRQRVLPAGDLRGPRRVPKARRCGSPLPTPPTPPARAWTTTWSG